MDFGGSGGGNRDVFNFPFSTDPSPSASSSSPFTTTAKHHPSRSPGGGGPPFHDRRDSFWLAAASSSSASLLSPSAPWSPPFPSPSPFHSSPELFPAASGFIFSNPALSQPPRGGAHPFHGPAPSTHPPPPSNGPPNPQEPQLFHHQPPQPSNEPFALGKRRATFDYDDGDDDEDEFGLYDDDGSFSTAAWVAGLNGSGGSTAIGDRDIFGRPQKRRNVADERPFVWPYSLTAQAPEQASPSQLQTGPSSWSNQSLQQQPQQQSPFGFAGAPSPAPTDASTAPTSIADTDTDMDRDGDFDDGASSASSTSSSSRNWSHGPVSHISRLRRDLPWGGVEPGPGGLPGSAAQLQQQLQQHHHLLMQSHQAAAAAAAAAAQDGAGRQTAKRVIGRSGAGAGGWEESMRRCAMCQAEGSGQFHLRHLMMMRNAGARG